MALNDVQPSEGDTASLRLVFSGGLADGGALVFSEYSDSLRGWRRVFEIVGQIYLRSDPELRKLKLEDLLQIRIVGERQGSYETLLQIAWNIVGNRADAVLFWSLKKFLGFCKGLVTRHVSKKAQTTNIEELVAALEEMMAQEGIHLETVDQPRAEQLVFVDEKVEGEPEKEDATAPISRGRIIVETMDQALKDATQPLQSSCEKITVTSGRELIFGFGISDRQVIEKPLTLPLPKGTWTPAIVKFVRINRQTGRVLFLFLDRSQPEEGALYGKIVDPSLRIPENLYIRSFYEDAPLPVWVRQRAAERGRTNLLWEITAKAPERMLFH